MDSTPPLAAPAPYVIRVGNQYETQMADPTVRRPEQHARVKEIIGAADFDFACSNPFTHDVGDYTGRFTFIWYTVDGKIHFERIA